MRRCLIAACMPVVLFSMSALAGGLVMYRFDQTNTVADVSSVDIVAGNIEWDGGIIALIDGRNNPYGLPHWKKHGKAALIRISLAPASERIGISALSFAVQMDSTPGIKERKLELTSNVTGSTVLYTLYNYAGWVAAGKNNADDKLQDQEWSERMIDLSGVSALQGINEPVMFTLTFSDVSTGVPVDGNLRIDNIVVEGSVAEMPVTLGLKFQ